MWNLPADTTSLESNEEVPGEVGTNSVNDLTEYAPPCSQGPGEKTYTVTVYALSAEPEIAEPAETTYAALLDAIDGLVLDEAALDVTYSRDAQEGRNDPAPPPAPASPAPSS